MEIAETLFVANQSEPTAHLYRLSSDACSLWALDNNTLISLCAILWGYAFYVYLYPKPNCKCRTMLRGKIVVITGGTDGVGKETAMELAKRGAKIIVPSRNMQKGHALAEEILRKTGNPYVKIFYADFERLESVKSCVEKIYKTVSHIDILVNNAGIGHGIGITEDGLPKIFGVNHLAPYYLTTRLIPLLRKSQSPRVIFVSSVAHLWGQIDFNTILQPDGSWVPAQFRAYARSKLANVLFAREINRREKSIHTYVAHPGWTFTSLFREFPFLLKLAVFPLFYLFLYQPKEGAQTQIHLALAKDLEKLSGEYFVSCRPSRTCQLALDCQLAKQLWSYSEKVVTPLLSSEAENCVAI